MGKAQFIRHTMNSLGYYEEAKYVAKLERVAEAAKKLPIEFWRVNPEAKEMLEALKELENEDTVP